MAPTPTPCRLCGSHRCDGPPCPGGGPVPGILLARRLNLAGLSHPALPLEFTQGNKPSCICGSPACLEGSARGILLQERLQRQGLSMAHALVVETARAMPANPWTTYTQRAMPASEPPMPTRSESPESAPKKVELPAVEPEPEPEVHATTQADTPTTQEGPEDEDREVPAGGLIQFQTSFRLSDRLIQNQDVPMDEALSFPAEIPRLPEETVDESFDIGTHRLPDLDEALPEEAVDDTLEMLVNVSVGEERPKKRLRGTPDGN